LYVLTKQYLHLSFENCAFSSRYKAHLSGGTGRFANATGDMFFIGEIHFNTGNVVLRYSGAVCVSGSN
jgi:hypothetical protein